jgi:prepilin-type N-terminal cleavage/methylation domain-containing protein
MRQHSRHRDRGFTMLELIIVLVLVLLAALITFPLVQKMISRASFESTAQQLAATMRAARLEAIRRSAPAVVQIDEDTHVVTVFIDLNNANAATGYRGSDLVYNPEVPPASALNDNARDFYVPQLQLPLTRKVNLAGPTAHDDFIDGLTPDPGDGEGPRVVFNPDGSVLDPGGYRLNDGLINNDDEILNSIEVTVAPAAAARIQLRKWHKDDDEWYARDMKRVGSVMKTTWEWY